VAYADFVTAMMAFFLVMWLINTSPQVRSPMASYFRDPGIFDTPRGRCRSGRVDGAMAGNADTPPVAAAKAALEETAETIRRQLESLPDFPEIKARVEIEMTAEGLRIEMLDDDKRRRSSMWAVQTATQMIDILKVITGNVKQLTNRSRSRGTPTAGRTDPTLNYSNWQLSSDRANAAARRWRAKAWRQLSSRRCMPMAARGCDTRQAARSAQSPNRHRHPLTSDRDRQEPAGLPPIGMASSTPVAASGQSPTPTSSIARSEARAHVAGAVAHDVNNLLHVILGCCERLRSGSTLSPDQSDELKHIMVAAEHAAMLTRQVLAAGQPHLDGHVEHRLHAALGRLKGLLERVCGDTITFDMRLPADTCARADGRSRHGPKVLGTLRQTRAKRCPRWDSLASSQARDAQQR
jgi:chemotaxis protein MotB